MSVGAVTATVAVLLPPFAVAVTVTVAAVWTGMVVRVNVPLVAPATMLNVLGTVPAALFEESPTGYPPVGAALEIVTVPVEAVPPITVV